MAQNAFNGHGLSDNHAISNYNLGQVNRRVGGALRRSGKNRSRKGDFENQAKLMQYGADLKDFHRKNEFNDKLTFANNERDIADWHNTRAPGHAAAMMTAQREAGVIRDDKGNVLGETGGSWKGAEGTSGSVGGWQAPKKGKAEKTEDNPHGQGQQMKQFAGPRKVSLGENIPTLTSKNSTTDNNGRISTIGSTRYNFGRRAFESNVDNRDAYQNQQDTQDQQADNFHNRGQQMSLF